MKYQDIIELKKRMEFKMTEPETLVKLVRDAQSKGEKMRKDMERLRNMTFKLSEVFKKNGLIFTESTLEEISLKYKCAVGIDGSFQLSGGVGGKWYVPISVARIIFEEGFRAQPCVDIFWAGIEEIEELEDYKVKRIASIRMLIGETKAILNWGTLNKEAYVFIDGPIVDPPVISYGGEKYIEYRCRGIKKCLEKSIVIGCVKRSRDKFYIEYLKDLISEESEKKYLNQFPSDQHLMAYIFAQVRSKGYYGPLFTKWIDISSSNSVYKLYKDEGIHIVSLFFQKDVKSKILRLDVPFLEPLSEKLEKIDNEIMHIVKAVNEWTYPGQDSPVPVLLAHNKCNIREGCAEILYEEIIAKSQTTDPLNQAVLTWMR
ncbi:MAG: DNA double-strand break repair nuclease NurA [Candidatus Methanomethylicaceae archaeon]